MGALVCWSVCLFVCLQDYVKTTWMISHKLGRVERGQRKKASHFLDDPFNSKQIFFWGLHSLDYTNTRRS